MMRDDAADDRSLRLRYRIRKANSLEGRRLVIEQRWVAWTVRGGLLCRRRRRSAGAAHHQRQKQHRRREQRQRGPACQDAAAHQRISTWSGAGGVERSALLTFSVWTGAGGGGPPGHA